MMSDDKNKADKPQLTKIERLKQRQKSIAAQLRKEENKEKAKERKADTRRKIIMGALALSHMEKDAEFRATCERLQREGITRNTDRELFGLDPIPEESKN
jgi:large subunit ribosomal protein L7/L12